MKQDERRVVIIGRWKNTRFWAVWLDRELLAVVLYKKGALAIKKTILDLEQRNPN